MVFRKNDRFIKNDWFIKTNKKETSKSFERTLKIYIFFTEPTNFQSHPDKKNIIFFWSNFVLEINLQKKISGFFTRTNFWKSYLILLKEWFNWTKSSNRKQTKKMEINKTIILRMNETNFCELLKKIEKNERAHF